MEQPLKCIAFVIPLLEFAIVKRKQSGPTRKVTQLLSKLLKKAYEPFS